MRHLDPKRARSTLLTAVSSFRAAITLVLIALCPTIWAGNVWDGGGGNDYWTSGSNWNPATGDFQFPPLNNGTADIVMPAVTGLVQAPIVNVPYSIRSLTIDIDDGNGRFVILCAEELTIGGGGITNNDADMQSIVGPVKLSANQTWTAEGLGRMQIDTVDLNGRSLLLRPIDGPIDMSGVIGGAGSLSVDGGDGTAGNGFEPVTIGGAGSNSYSGSTIVRDRATLILHKEAGWIAIPGHLSVGFIATVRLEADEQISHAPGNSVSLPVQGAWLDLNGHIETIAVLRLGPYSRVTTDAGKLIVGERIESAPPWNAGSATITGNVDLNGGVRQIIGIDSDSEVYDQLIIDGSISNGGATFDQNVILRGAPNTYTDQTVILPSGNLRLEKSGVDGAIRGNLTIQGIVRLGGNEQIFGSVLLDGGILKLNGLSETVQDLSLRDGSVPGAGTISATGIVSVLGGGGDSVIDPSVNLQGTRIFNVEADTAPSTPDLTINGIVSNGGIWKSGGGTMQLTNSSNTYAGGTTVSEGTLLVTNVSGSGTGTGSVTVNSGGTLGGTGIINTSTSNASVTVSSGGSLSPGTSAGTLTLALGTGSLNLSAVATGGLKFELGTPSTPSASDRIVVNSGTLNIGTLDFSAFTFTNLGAVAAGTYTLFDAQSDITGSIGTASGNIGGFAATLSVDNAFDNVLLTVTGVAGDYNANGVVDAADYVVWRIGGALLNDPTPGNQPADYDYWRMRFGNSSPGSGAGFGMGASDNEMAAVPEPATMVMLIVGLWLMSFCRRAVN